MSSARRATSSRKRGGFIRDAIEYIVLLVVVFAVFWAGRVFVVEPYSIPSGSMETTLMINDCVFSEKVSYHLCDVQQGDIVTFADPEVEGRTLIKRVIATEGQTVDLVNGAVSVDGQVLDEPYTHGLPSEELTPARNVQISYPYTVPAGYVWVMGDNRTNSADSRYFGAVPTSNITGRAAAIYWPLNRIATL